MVCLLRRRATHRVAPTHGVCSRQDHGWFAFCVVGRLTESRLPTVFFVARITGGLPFAPSGDSPSRPYPRCLLRPGSRVVCLLRRRPTHRVAPTHGVCCRQDHGWFAFCAVGRLTESPLPTVFFVARITDGLPLAPSGDSPSRPYPRYLYWRGSCHHIFHARSRSPHIRPRPCPIRFAINASVSMTFPVIYGGTEGGKPTHATSISSTRSPKIASALSSSGTGQDAPACAITPERGARISSRVSPEKGCRT